MPQYSFFPQTTTGDLKTVGAGTVNAANINQFGGTTQTGRDLGRDLFPIAKGRIFNTSVATATNFYGSDLTVTNSPTLMRIFCCMNTATRLDARITNTATTVTAQLNSGNNLTANAGYMFDVLLRTGDTLNFRHSDAGAVTVLYMIVDEIPQEQ